VSSASHLTSKPGSALIGTVRAPGDKSMSHRSMILGAMASGVTEVEGLLEGDDVLATARAVEAFGAEVERLGDGKWRITGRAASDRPPASSTAATPARACGC
jgi:3-phosphoshikimate 1-carboxyvinyltransferase